MRGAIVRLNHADMRALLGCLLALAILSHCLLALAIQDPLKADTLCEPWCSKACADLNGDLVNDCGACDTSFACHAGVEGFLRPSVPMRNRGEGSGTGSGGSGGRGSGPGIGTVADTGSATMGGGMGGGRDSVAGTLTPRAIADLHALGYDTVIGREPKCTRNSCTYAAARTADTQTNYIVKVQAFATNGKCADGDCRPCEREARLHLGMNALLAARHGAGQQFLTQAYTPSLVGERCELLVLPQRRERGGPLLGPALIQWVQRCVVERLKGGAAPPTTYPLDLKCILHQLLHAFALLQRRPAVVHADMHSGQILLRTPLPRLPCSANGTHRPLVVLADFEKAFAWSDRSAATKDRSGAAGGWQGARQGGHLGHVRDGSSISWPPELARAMRQSLGRLASCDEVDGNSSRVWLQETICSHLMMKAALVTPWSWDAWGLAGTMSDLSLAGSLMPTHQSLLQSCEDEERSDQTAAQQRPQPAPCPPPASADADDGSERESRRASERRLARAVIHACARRHAAANEAIFERAQRSARAFRAYMRALARAHSSRHFGSVWLGAVEQLGAGGIHLLGQLAAIDPRDRPSPCAALHAPWFADLHPSCPSAAAAHGLACDRDIGL